MNLKEIKSMRNQISPPVERVRVAVISDVAPSNDQQLTEGIFVLLTVTVTLLAMLSLSIG